MKKLIWWMIRRPGAAPHLALVDPDAPPSEHGYSLLELERAGLTQQRARALGLPVNPARPSALGSNVALLEERVRGE